MTNRLTNAGALDGVSGWTATAGMTLSKDEAARGAPGRGVFRASGTSSSAGQSFAVTPASNVRADVQGVSVVEISLAAAAFVAGAAVPPFVRLVFFDASGAVLMAHDLTVRRPVLASWGVARDGLLDTYYRAWARIERPASAVSAAVEAGGRATGAGQAIEAVLLKPLIAEAPHRLPGRDARTGASAGRGAGVLAARRAAGGRGRLADLDGAGRARRIHADAPPDPARRYADADGPAGPGRTGRSVSAEGGLCARLRHRHRTSSLEACGRRPDAGLLRRLRSEGSACSTRRRLAHAVRFITDKLREGGARG